MKSFIRFISGILFFIVLFSINDIVNAQSPRMKDRFYLGAYNFFFLNQLHNSTHMAFYDSLFYNAMQNYCAHTDFYPTGWNNTQFDGGFFEPLANYRDYINNNILGTWRTFSGDNSLIFEREKVLRPCFGQRSTYIVTSPGNHYPDFPNYFYQTSSTGSDVADYIFAGGASVRRCIVGSDTTGFIIKNLYENCEQVNNIDSTADSTVSDSKRLWSDLKERMYSNRWFIKPRLRIDSTYAKSHPEDTVCVLYVNRFDGTRLDTFPIFCNNFLLRYGLNDKYYDGRYLEMFYQISENGQINNNPTAFSVDAWALKTGRTTNPDNLSNSQVDYYIKWWGKVDTYLQYLRVDDSWAHYLFTDTIENSTENIWNFHQKIKSEVDSISNTPGFGYFYVDEVCYNSIPCVEEVNRLVKKYSNNQTSVVTFQSIDDMVQKAGLRYGPIDFETKAAVREALIQNNFTTNLIINEAYPFPIWIDYPPNLSIQDPNNVYYTTRFLHRSASSSNYNDAVQQTISSDLSIKRNYSSLAKVYGLIYNLAYQVHSDDGSLDPVTGQGWALREPTNEEIRLQPYLAMAYGVKQLEQYSFYSYWHNINKSIEYFSLGLMDPFTGNDSPRYLNYYGQAKWDSVKRLNGKLKAMGNYMYPTGATSQHLQYENTICVNTDYDYTGAQHLPFSYLSNLTSFYGDNNGQWNDTNALQKDPVSKRYYEIGFYNDPNNSVNKYMLVVNKRCVPVQGDYGDLRTLKFYFTDLNNYNNWVLKDVMTSESVTFDKNSTGGVYFPHPFQPGEGKLFCLTPLMETGGTLQYDEYIQNETFTCQDTLYTNGHNLTIGFGTTINFSDSGCIVVNGGSFICGDVTQPTHTRNIIFRGNSNSWSGLTFNGCGLVNINSAQFQNVKGDEENTNYAVKMINCSAVNINNCTFTNADPQKSGAIESIYSGSANDTPPLLYISGNTFNMNTSDKTIVSVIANSGSSVPAMLDNNIFTSTSNSATAMYLAFVSGVEISGNAIVGYNKAVEMHYSNIDVIGNSITSTTGNNGAKGIDAQDFSAVNLTSNGAMRTGGMNIIDNVGENINNIYVNNSYFYLSGGKNIFNIIPNSNSYHLKGIFPGSSGDNVLDESLNCFKLNNVAIVESNLPVKDVKWGDTEGDIDFNFFTYDCGTSGECNEMVVDMGNSVFDTICIVPGGSGGGVPGVQTITPKRMYDSLCILMRLRNFSEAKEKCYQLLNTFPDSSQGLNAISKLYYLAVTLDTSTVNITDCKTFLNSLILNHPNNLSLVRKCNYYVQKCKVKLKQYQSAMTGFQQIMQQNPYSYEALLASWDYAATHLLDSLNGAGGSSSENENIDYSLLTIHDLHFTIDEFSSDDILSLDYDALFEKTDNLLFNDDDKDAFTKEQRKTISTSVVTALEDTKKKSKNHIEELTKRSEEGNSDAVVELKVIKTLKEVVKVKKPKSIFEHIKSVNKDIQKLNTVKNETVKKVMNTIPTSYNLSQNYPNPFNPVTKINYELPKDGKVKLVIYDILGREIKTLVNEIKQAGRYTIEFNGNQYASGVYFFRIQVEGGKSFTSVKKMLMIK
jgi:hypothetical protein